LILKNPPANPRLVYVIGTYPGLTTTFIDREINILRGLCDFEIHLVSLRHPPTLDNLSPQQRAFHDETLYLLPAKWADFPLASYLWAGLYFLFTQPGRYFSTLFDLLKGPHPDLKARLKSLLHFWMGIHAAFLLRKLDFDHIHAHFMDRSVIVTLVMSRILGKSYSFTAHASDIFIKPALMRLKLRNARFVVTVSKFNREHFQRVAPNFPAEKIHILHPWVDPEKFSPPAAVPREGDRFRILSVGRLVEKKGHVDLIRAAQLLRERGLDFECRIAGGGPLQLMLESEITRLGLKDHVILLGEQSQSQILELLGNWADVFVLPCVIAHNGDRDGMPVSIAEAMSMKLPVISTDIIGIRELVQPGVGFLVRPQDPLDLSRALEQIMGMGPEERRAMGQCGREVVEAEFNLTKGVLELAALFRNQS
jgi:glycosyltransferase involved in cell wall biosynthesis